MKTSKKAYTYKMKLVPANILGVIIFVILIVLTYFLNINIMVDGNFFIILLVMILYLMLHEVMHGLGYFLGGTKLRNIAYGIKLEQGILYCQSFQEITKKNILLSLQMPFMTIGVITYIIGVIYSLNFLVLLSIINLVGASMDLVMFFYILKLPKNITYSESGEPDEFILISDEDLTKYKSTYFEITNTKKYKKEDYVFKNIKKIIVSNTSFIVIGLIIIFGLLSLI